MKKERKRELENEILIFLAKKKYTVISIISVIVLLILWTLGSYFHWFNPTFIPSIGAVKNAFLDACKNGYRGYSLSYHIMSSMKRLVIAIVLAFVVSMLFGILCGMNKTILAIVDPFIQFYRALPPLAYNALLVLWMGIGDQSKIVLLFLSAFAPMFIQTVFGVQRIPEARINAAKSLGAGRVALLFQVILPSALPDILTGLRTSVGITYATLVAAEMVASTSGLGWLVLNASKYIQYDVVYFGIIIMGAIAILIDVLIRAFIRKVTPWQEHVA